MAQTVIMRLARIFIISIVSIAILQTCKIEGCTDSSASNYNSKANSNDGSCIFKGEVIFWVDTTFHFNDISVIIDDSVIGVIDGYFTDQPECGIPHSVNIELEEGIYEFTAIDTLGSIYSDTFNIERNLCTAKQIIVDSLQ